MPSSRNNETGNGNNRRPTQQQQGTMPGWLAKLPDCLSEDFGVPMGRILGVPIKIHFTFILTFIIELVVAIASKRTPKYSWLMFLCYGPLLLMSVFISELCAVIYAQSRKSNVEKMVLWPVGGYVFVGRDITEKLDDCKVAYMAVFMYLPQILVYFIVLLSTNFKEFGKAGEDVEGLQEGDFSRFLAEMAGEMIILNLTIFVMNLLIPAYPLACSRFLPAILVNRGMEKLVVAWYMSVVGMIECVLVLVTAILFNGSGLGIMLMSVAFYVFMGACKLFMLAKSDQHMLHPIFARTLYGGGTEYRQTYPTTPEQPRMVGP